METRPVIVALVAILNFAVETLEKLLAADVIEGAGKNDAKRDKDKDKKSVHTRPPRTKAAAVSTDADEEEEEEEEEKEEEKEEEEETEPSEDDVIDAVRAAQKVIEKAEIAKILKTKGRAARASEVEPARRQAVIDALSEAVDAAD